MQPIMHMRYPARQRGAVLIISLIILIVLTILGVTAMQSTTLEEKMAGNMRERDIAFQSAEAALREGESFLENVALPDFDDTDGLYKPADATPLWLTVDWSTGSSDVRDVTEKVALLDDAYQPTYIIEELPASIGAGDTLVTGFAPPQAAGNYRVTARGLGPAGTGNVMVQSYFRR